MESAPKPIPPVSDFRESHFGMRASVTPLTPQLMRMPHTFAQSIEFAVPEAAASVFNFGLSYKCALIRQLSVLRIQQQLAFHSSMLCCEFETHSSHSSTRAYVTELKAIRHVCSK